MTSLPPLLVQVLRSPSAIQDLHKWEAALGYEQIAANKVYECVTTRRSALPSPSNPPLLNPVD